MGGVTWTYRYDPFGRRYSKTASTGAVTIYLPDEHNNEAGEYDGLTGNILRENAFDPLQVAPIAVLSYTNGANPVVVFNHRDRLGSVVATSSAPNSSSNGILLGQYIYDAWGQSAPLTGTGFGYAGYRYDAETGLYYNRARYYDPRLGRFLSTDPLGQGPGLNVYAYVGDDPLNLVDPSGLTAKDVVAAVGNAIIPSAQGQVLPLPGVVPPPPGTVTTDSTDQSAQDLSNAITNAVHGNSYNNMQGTEVYNLVNRDTGAIDKIGITSNPNSRYSAAQLTAMNVDYVTVATYQSRYAAALHENISLVHYFVNNGALPKYNSVFR